MKKSLLFATILLACGLATHAQTDTMYVMKAGAVIKKYNIKTQVDSVIFYKPMVEPTTFIDARDGNVYEWVTIGDQVWMAENLKYLPSVVGPSIGSDSLSHYYVYNYDGTDVDAAKATSNYATYGVLYNWAAAMAGSPSSWANPSGVQGVCPTGWHLPSNAEWNELARFLKDNNLTSYDLKEIGTTHWAKPNEGATNETGFTALPGGYKSDSFKFIGWWGYWWSATMYGKDRALTFRFYSTIDTYIDYIPRSYGVYVRCVKD